MDYKFADKDEAARVRLEAEMDNEVYQSWTHHGEARRLEILLESDKVDEAYKMSRKPQAKQAKEAANASDKRLKALRKRLDIDAVSEAARRQNMIQTLLHAKEREHAGLDALLDYLEEADKEDPRIGEGQLGLVELEASIQAYSEMWDDVKDDVKDEKKD
jgi:hypothetical protein